MGRKAVKIRLDAVISRVNLDANVNKISGRENGGSTRTLTQSEAKISGRENGDFSG